MKTVSEKIEEVSLDAKHKEQILNLCECCFVLGIAAHETTGITPEGNQAENINKMLMAMVNNTPYFYDEID